MTVLTLKAQIDAGNAVVVAGRAAWALLELLAAGHTGCTYFDNPAPRWSSYIHKLRKLGVIIDTLQEAHGGPFAGFHARYVLRSSVTVLEIIGGLS
ncbi:winged helix domain-containing protein [Bradyrhizobium sp. 25ACV]